MIKVQNTINAPIEKVWELWTLPEHIKKWNNASQDWHTPYVENDLTVGSKFKFTMALKDGSEGFDFEGIYTNIQKFSLIEYKLFDNRTANVRFESEGTEVKITETFEPTTKNSADLEEQFCTAIIQNFKEYVENFKE
ncbi:polyketide cyclase [Flavobacteriaceae bacterium CRH]|nr:polyketide cyclase [Flavobacteriaceae bacterium CRH]